MVIVFGHHNLIPFKGGKGDPQVRPAEQRLDPGFNLLDAPGGKNGIFIHQVPFQKGQDCFFRHILDPDNEKAQN
jgi:hypothetical protein